MAQRATVTLVTAPAGSGKTFARCAVFMARFFLPQERGVHWSNFPVRREAMAAFVANQGYSEKVIAERIQTIPEARLVEWRSNVKGEWSGPWDFFENVDLHGAHIAIDEVHNYCGRSSPKAKRHRWQEWLGELRHRGATCEVISQAPQKIASEITWEAETKLELVNSELRRDPFFGVLLSDWYQLKAKLWGGVYKAFVWEYEYRNVNCKWKREARRSFELDPKYFALYDSYSKPQMGGKAAFRPPRREFESRPWGSFLSWFFWRNGLHVGARLALVSLIVWLACFGGGGRVISWWMAGFRRVGPESQIKRDDRPRQKLPAVAGKVSGVGLSTGSRESLQRSDSVGMPPRNIGRVPTGAASSQPSSHPAEDAELASLRAENDELRRRLECGRQVVLLTQTGLVFADGFRYSVGDVIESGDYKGRTIEGIRWERRSVLLSDGTVLRLHVTEGRDGAAGGLADRVNYRSK